MSSVKAQMPNQIQSSNVNNNEFIKVKNQRKCHAELVSASKKIEGL
jgi:hypothetical protein